jgi:hypothetical protein
MELTNGKKAVSAALAVMNVMMAKMKTQQDLGRIIQMVNGWAKIRNISLHVNGDDVFGPVIVFMLFAPIR